MEISRVIYFRTKECKYGSSCKFGDDQSLNCFDYHKKEDKRRLPYTKDKATGKFQLLYIDELCKKQCTKDDCPYAHNIYEQNYHPMKIKKVVCPDPQSCNFNIEGDQYKCDTEEKIISVVEGEISQAKSKNYCYKYHKNSEKEYYDKLRNIFEAQNKKKKDELEKNKFFVQGVADESIQHDKNQTSNSIQLNLTEFINEQNHDEDGSACQDFKFQSSFFNASTLLNDNKSPFGCTVADNKQDDSFLQNDILEGINEDQNEYKEQNIKNEIEIVKQEQPNHSKSHNSKNQKSQNTKVQKSNNQVSNKQRDEDKKSKQAVLSSPNLNKISDNQQKPQKQYFVQDKSYQLLQEKIFNEYKFEYNAIFDEEEGQMLEFKDYYFKQSDDSMNNGNQNQDIIISKTIKTILGFLNSQGGFIIFGIKDNKKIKGSQMNIDQFMNSITPKLANCQPPVIEKHYILHKLNLIGNKPYKIVILQVKPQKHKFFFDSKQCYYRRTNASVIMHEGLPLANVIKDNYKELYKRKLENSKAKLKLQIKQQLDEKQKIIDQQKKDYLQFLELIKTQNYTNNIAGIIDYKIMELENN
ncbi:hypothetical protein ABPG72_020298 [Tetrahymena utriculariae]